MRLKNMMRDILSSWVMSWSKLKSIADVGFVRSMYIWIFIVPIIATVLSRIEDIVPVVIFGYEFNLVAQLPFSWVVFFFSAFLFVVANAIYLFHCPNIIKDHSDYSQFKSHGKTKYHLTTYSLDLNFTWDEIQEVLENNDYAIHELLPIQEVGNSDSQSRDVFWVLMDKAEIHKINARRMASGCSIIAGFLLAYVLAQNVLTVSRYVIGTTL